MGLGYTQITDGQSVSPDAQVAMIVALLDTLAIDRVDVVANDSGGAVAQLLAAGHGECIRTLLLTNCDTEIESPPAALLPVIEMSKAGTFVDRWLGRCLADKALARSADGIGGMCYADPAHPTDEAIECYFSPFVSSARRKAQVHAHAIALERNPLAGVEAALRRCHAPTRTVWGIADGIFSSAGADYLNRVCGSSRGVRRLDGRRLFWPEELPEIVAEEAVRLWTSQAMRPRDGAAAVSSAKRGRRKDRNDAQATYPRDVVSLVDDLVKTALAAGGQPAAAPQDHGFLYGCSFYDLDGHHWEVFWMDPKHIQPE
jgi:haloalkane dehalogenase